jgi:hypothetical protein
MESTTDGKAGLNAETQRSQGAESFDRKNRIET